MDTITLPAEPAERSFPISWLFSVSPEANEHPCERIARKKPGASMVALIALGAALDGGVGRGEATISEALLGVGNRWKWRRVYGVHLDHRRGGPICVGTRLGRGGDFDGKPLKAAARVAFADALAFAEGPLV